MADTRPPEDRPDRPDDQDPEPIRLDGGGDPACWEDLIEDDERGVFGDHGY